MFSTPQVNIYSEDVVRSVDWTDDTDAAFARLVAAGASALSEPHDWLGGTLRVAWIGDPDDNPIELVQRLRGSGRD